jgi:DNA-binding NarL/FixJ family response regulator
VRVVIADDSALLREGLARILVEAGIVVTSMAGDAQGLLAAVEEHQPDVAIVDIRMPPTFTHEGAQAAVEVRRRWRGVGILLLSQSLEFRYAVELARTQADGFGYLLKDRVAGASTLVDAVQQVAAGGTVLDPAVVSYLLGRQGIRDHLRGLTDRERDVIALMAEGRSNSAIGRQLFLNPKTVEGHIASIFGRLGLHPEADDNRRVLAVLAWLESNR